MHKTAGPAVSKNIIESKDSSAQYDIILTKRVSKTPQNPRKNTSDLPPILPHKILELMLKWAIETAYRTIEEMRPKTRVVGVAARLFRFYYGLAAYNEWMILRMLYSDDTDRQSEFTQLTFKQGIESILIMEPKPPMTYLAGTFRLTDIPNTFKNSETKLGKQIVNIHKVALNYIPKMSLPKRI